LSKSKDKKYEGQNFTLQTLSYDMVTSSCTRDFLLLLRNPIFQMEMNNLHWIMEINFPLTFHEIKSIF